MARFIGLTKLYVNEVIWWIYICFQFRYFRRVLDSLIHHHRYIDLRRDESPKYITRHALMSLMRRPTESSAFIYSNALDDNVAAAVAPPPPAESPGKTERHPSATATQSIAIFINIDGHPSVLPLSPSQNIPCAPNRQPTEASHWRRSTGTT